MPWPSALKATTCSPTVWSRKLRAPLRNVHWLEPACRRVRRRRGAGGARRLVPGLPPPAGGATQAGRPASVGARAIPDPRGLPRPDDRGRTSTTAGRVPPGSRRGGNPEDRVNAQEVGRGERGRVRAVKRQALLIPVVVVLCGVLPSLTPKPPFESTEMRVCRRPCDDGGENSRIKDQNDLTTNWVL